jgi:hypothetical protein
VHVRAVADEHALGVPRARLRIAHDVLDRRATFARIRSRARAIASWKLGVNGFSG